MGKIKFVDFKKELSDKLNSKINNYCFYAFNQEFGNIKGQKAN